ncbi:hypothetical protein L2E82_37360 [Cichorium intybus]|uniref:Uncharacterized protein n=1 Tax=Cichorium intybus TaxID=13427 RepID=A0ACB9AEQ0_CICIN|nr:hypothetical protein L2E82_37360 [Cichorium intybus]
MACFIPENIQNYDIKMPSLGPLQLKDHCKIPVLDIGALEKIRSGKHESEFFAKNGFPKMPFANGWKGKYGLYAAGFTRRGLAGASADP